MSTVGSASRTRATSYNAVECSSSSGPSRVTKSPLAIASTALALAAKGEGDVCLVHAPDSEKKYVADGLLVNRRLVMHNDFLLVGPASDPAKIKGMASAVEAMQRVAEAKGTFVSRGDNSGTHQLEKKLWQEAKVTPEGAWYLQAGQGIEPAPANHSNLRLCHLISSEIKNQNYPIRVL